MGETFFCTRFGIKKSPSSGVKEIFAARARSMVFAVVSWVSLQKSFGHLGQLSQLPKPEEWATGIISRPSPCAAQGLGPGPWMSGI